MRNTCCVVAVVLLSACHFKSSVTSGTSGTTPSSNSATTSSASNEATETAPASEETSVSGSDSSDQAWPGMLMSKQLQPIKGMKLEEAKAFLKKLGHDGKVLVDKTDHIVKDCKPETVCKYGEWVGKGEDGDIGVHDDITLMFNNTNVDITMPD